ncbi:MAG: hypothetical protein BRC31_07565 [Actinobacteria bacterium QS_5_72_10]|nr:MAG: hypothetical protein BRC31_07565 [Actinobacteria bacterium QS_5_72_10]
MASDGDDLSAPDPSEPQAPTGSSQQPQGSDDDASTQPQPAPEPQPAPDDDQNADSNTASGSSTVAISDFDYQPGTLTVPAGTTITWRNSDVAAHTVTADDSTFDSQRIAPDGSFSVTLDEPGTYTYHCEFHPNMEATIEVTG